MTIARNVELDAQTAPEVNKTGPAAKARPGNQNAIRHCLCTQGSLVSTPKSSWICIS